MKKLAAILVILAAAAVAASAPPIKVPRLAVATRAAGTVVWVKYTISATPSDSLTVDLSATGQASVHRMYLADSKADSISYPKPAPGASISGVVLGKNFKNGRQASAQGPWTYVEPDTIVVPPSVTVTVTPASVTLSPGQTAVFRAVLN